MRFNKQDMEMWINEYGSLKEDGLSLKDIQKHFKQKYGLKDISSIRKNHDILKRSLGVEINQSEKDIKAIAQAKADLLVNRKINIQMNKTLHQKANCIASKELILSELKKFKYTKYELTKNIYNDNRNDLKDVIYILGDIHYRGSIDDDLVINTFKIIKNEIDNNHYQNVDLWLTGDLIDGEIKEGQQRYNEPVIKCACKIANIMIECINQIPNIKNVKLVYGNHSEIRLWGEKNTENNAEEFIGEMFKIGFRNNINFEHGTELFFKYKGKEIVLTHGNFDYCKNKSKLVEHCDTTYGRQPHIIVLGHYHSAKTTQFSRNRWLIVAPAVKDWQSNWDRSHSYCGFGQIDRLKLNMDTPQITTINVVEELR